MPVSKLDTAYRSLVISKFFSKGWGTPENLKRIFEFRKIVSNRETCYKLVPSNYPVTITKEVVSSNSILLEGHFTTPFVHYLPGLVPKASENAYFQVLLPKKWQSEYYKPVCLHLAGTGDHYFFRRRNLMAKPLLKIGIGGILLENPFYGFRKPKGQTWSCLNNVSDIFVMGGCLVLESLVLFHWCKRNGLGPLGVTGISMGGHMASLAATAWPEPLVLVPCLSWSTASGVFTKGVMSTAIDWQLLEDQYFSDEIYSKELKQMVKVVNYDTFKAGQHFAKHYPESMDRVSQISSDENVKFNSNRITPKFQFPVNVNGKPDKVTNSSNTDVLREVLLESASVEYIKNLDNKNTTSKQETTDKNFFSPYLSWTSFKKQDQNNTKVVGSENGVKSDAVSNVKDAKTSSETVTGKSEKTFDKRTDFQKREALQFMCGIMDECTHLTNFSMPVDPELIINVIASDDAYVPADGNSLKDIWPGSEIRCVNAGHVGAFLLHQKVFRCAIVEAFEKLKEKNYKDKLEAEVVDKAVQESENR